MPQRIVTVYKDPRLLIVDKPAGLCSQSRRRGEPSLLSHLLAQQPAPLHVVHALDAEASGLMVLARDRETAAALKEALLRGGIERQYMAVVDGVPRPAEGRIELRIGRAHEKAPNSANARQKAHPAQSRYGQPATTHYRLIKTADAPPELRGTSLLWLRLETARPHQIRVHLAAIGHPILGDLLYGGRASSRLLLHASRLCLNVGKGWPIPKDFTSPPPSCFGAFAQESRPATGA